MADSLASALSDIPDGLRSPLISQFEELLAEYRSGKWETVGLKAGKICEIVYSILSGHCSGAYEKSPTKPKNMVAACIALEQSDPARFSRSVRIQIPRLLIAVYELRNNRAIGHVGGDVDPNHMDAEFFLRAAKWLIAELIRVFASVSVDAARDIVESVTERVIPVVWESNGTKRVLNPKLSAKDKALVLAYSTPGPVSVRTIADWSGYANLSRFRSTIIVDLDKSALIHFDRGADSVTISPTGIRAVESANLLSLT